MKPLLTHSRPTLLETLPVCCNPLARLLTTTEQLTQVILHEFLTFEFGFEDPKIGSSFSYFFLCGSKNFH